MPQALRVKTLITTTMALTVAGVVATAVPAYATPGGLDSTFGTGGVVTTDFGASPAEPEIANDMAIQPDGKIVTAGRAGVDQTPIGGDGAFGIARYLPDGSLDPAFGTGGLVKTKFQAPPNRDIARAVALQSDGKILVGGTSGVFDTPAKLALARYNTDGSLDSSFGTGGIVLMNVSNGLGDAIRGLAVQPDGKILGVGAAGGENLLIRFNTDGTLDSSFGNGGTSQPVLGSSGHLFAMKLLSDGTFVAAGTGTTGANQGDFLVARFTSTGALDTSFGTGGLTITAITAQNDLVFDMAVAGNGQIILAGEANSGDVLGVTGDTHFGLARYNANGSLDTSFGTAGIVDDNLTVNQDEARGIVLQSDGRIVVAGPRDGSNVHADPTTGSMAVVRYNADGSRDTTFGTGGVATTMAGGSAAGARDVALDSAGRIVVCGGALMAGTGVDFAVARFQP